MHLQDDDHASSTLLYSWNQPLPRPVSAPPTSPLSSCWSLELTCKQINWKKPIPFTTTTASFGGFKRTLYCIFNQVYRQSNIVHLTVFFFSRFVLSCVVNIAACPSSLYLYVSLSISSPNYFIIDSKRPISPWILKKTLPMCEAASAKNTSVLEWSTFHLFRILPALSFIEKNPTTNKRIWTGVKVLN